MCSSIDLEGTVPEKSLRQFLPPNRVKSTGNVQ